MNFRYRFVDRIGIINVSISKYTFYFMFNLIKILFYSIRIEYQTNTNLYIILYLKK